MAVYRKKRRPPQSSHLFFLSQGLKFWISFCPVSEKQFFQYFVQFLAPIIGYLALRSLEELIFAFSPWITVSFLFLQEYWEDEVEWKGIQFNHCNRLQHSCKGAVFPPRWKLQDPRFIILKNLPISFSVYLYIYLYSPKCKVLYFSWDGFSSWSKSDFSSCYCFGKKKFQNQDIICTLQHYYEKTVISEYWAHRTGQNYFHYFLFLHTVAH